MTRILIITILSFILFQQAFSLYGSNSKVIKLTASNFREKVLNSNQLWFVEFYGKKILEFF